MLMLITWEMIYRNLLKYSWGTIILLMLNLAVIELYKIFRNLHRCSWSDERGCNLAPVDAGGLRVIWGYTGTSTSWWGTIVLLQLMLVGWESYKYTGTSTSWWRAIVLLQLMLVSWMSYNDIQEPPPADESFCLAPVDAGELRVIQRYTGTSASKLIRGYCLAHIDPQLTVCEL